MWRLVGAVVGVFAAWGGALALALAGGAPLQATELGAGVGAGVTLLLWGLLGARGRTRAELPTTAAGVDESRRSRAV